MQWPTVVIANSDSACSALLARELRERARNVVIASSSDELPNTIRKHRAEALVADLETISLESVSQLRSEFPELKLICTHRVPDEQMWADSLGAGAADCCSSNDVDDVIRAALGKPYARAHAA